MRRVVDADGRGARRIALENAADGPVEESNDRVRANIPHPRRWVVEVNGRERRFAHGNLRRRAIRSVDREPNIQRLALRANVAAKAAAAVASAPVAVCAVGEARASPIVLVTPAVVVAVAHTGAIHTCEAGDACVTRGAGPHTKGAALALARACGDVALRVCQTCSATQRLRAEHAAVRSIVVCRALARAVPKRAVEA